MKNNDPKLGGNESKNVGISNHMHFSIILFQATHLLKMWKYTKGRKATFENLVKTLKELPMTTFIVEEMTKAQLSAAKNENK